MVGRGVDPYGTGGHIPHIFFQKEGGVSFGKLWRTNTCYRTKCQQNQPNGFWDIKIFWLSRGRHPPSWIFKFLVDHQIWRPNVDRRAKLYQNRSKGRWDIVFKNFQNGGRPPSWIFKSLIFWTADRWALEELICAIMQNFVKICQTVFEISRFFDFPDGCHPPYWILKFSNFWLVIFQFVFKR